MGDRPQLGEQLRQPLRRRGPADRRRRRSRRAPRGGRARRRCPLPCARRSKPIGPGEGEPPAGAVAAVDRAAVADQEEHAIRVAVDHRRHRAARVLAQRILEVAGGELRSAAVGMACIRTGQHGWSGSMSGRVVGRDAPPGTCRRPGRGPAARRRSAAPPGRAPRPCRAPALLPAPVAPLVGCRVREDLAPGAWGRASEGTRRPPAQRAEANGTDGASQTAVPSAGPPPPSRACQAGASGVKDVGRCAGADRVEPAQGERTDDVRAGRCAAGRRWARGSRAGGPGGGRAAAPRTAPRKVRRLPLPPGPAGHLARRPGRPVERLALAAARAGHPARAARAASSGSRPRSARPRSRTDAEFHMGITPYYAALMDPDDPSCPIRLQSVPTLGELNILPSDLEDPLAEERDMPVPGITHRYPDRVLFYTTHNCPVYCRHCTRKRKVADPTSAAAKRQIEDVARLHRAPRRDPRRGHLRRRPALPLRRPARLHPGPAPGHPPRRDLPPGHAQPGDPAAARDRRLRAACSGRTTRST